MKEQWNTYTKHKCGLIYQSALSRSRLLHIGPDLLDLCPLRCKQDATVSYGDAVWSESALSVDIPIVYSSRHFELISNFLKNFLNLSKQEHQWCWSSVALCLRNKVIFTILNCYMYVWYFESVLFALFNVLSKIPVKNMLFMLFCI